MKIDELIKLALVNHDIDQEKMLNNILKKGRKRIAVRKTLISISLSAILVIPIMVMAFSFTKGDTPLVPTNPIITDTSMVDTPLSNSTINWAQGDTLEFLYENGNVVFREEDQIHDECETFISPKLREELKKYDNDTKFFIKAYYRASHTVILYYEGKTFDEWSDEAYIAKMNYDAVLKGYKEGSVEKAKSEMEAANKRFEKAWQDRREKELSLFAKYLSEKNIEILLSDKGVNTAFFVCSKETLLRMKREEKEDIIIKFYLGSEDDLQRAMGQSVSQ